MVFQAITVTAGSDTLGCVSDSKLSYRVNKRLVPHLESLGFKKVLGPREWVRVTNNVMCAVAMVPSPYRGRSYEDVTKGSFTLTVGVAYPALNFGFSETIDHPERGGIGWCNVRARMTRSPGVEGPKNVCVWDPSIITHDEAIHDAITAVDTQGAEFFDKWTNHEFAYNKLLDDAFDPTTEAGNVEAGVAKLFWFGGKPGSLGRLADLASLAAVLGRTEDEIKHIERMNALSDELTGSGEGAGEHALKRLAKLKGS